MCTVTMRTSAQLPVKISRRGFAFGAIVAASAMAISGCGGGAAAANLQSSAAVTSDYLQNILFLQAEALAYGLTGAGVDTADPNGPAVVINGPGTQGATTGGVKVTILDANSTSLLNELDGVLRRQMTAIQALGGVAIGKPAINLNALGYGFGSQAEYLDLVRQLLDFGASVLLKSLIGFSDPAKQSAAAEIAAVQLAYGSALRALIRTEGSQFTIIDSVDPVLSVAVAQVTSSSVLRDQSASTTYLMGAGATSGRFFPKGLNAPLP